jgi:hypothetical protein
MHRKWNLPVRARHRTDRRDSVRWPKLAGMIAIPRGFAAADRG